MKPIRSLRPAALTRCAVRHERRRLSTAQDRVSDTTETPYLAAQSVPKRSGYARAEHIENARPFSDFLTDTFNRQHDYLRISLTERCNLRCLYCMPEEGVELSPADEILSTPEIEHLSRLFVSQGVTKIRLTGGEPTVRSDILPLMHKIGQLRSIGLKELALTTNGISLHRKLDSMVEAGLTGVNISLDTLDPFQYQILTRRQGFNAVMKSIERVKDMNKAGAGVKLKVNCVVMRGLNDHQVLPFVEWTRNEDLEVRFIEYMPFGGNKWSRNKMLGYQEMLDMIRGEHPTLQRLKDAHTDTSKTWQVPGFAGRVGFITSMTHNFCGSCNRLRITSDGNLKVCLHGNAEVSLRDIMRGGAGQPPLDDGSFSNLQPEGWDRKQQELLAVIGSAVKRKKEKHAGIGELEKMKNRPMILIGEAMNTGSTIRSLSANILSRAAYKHATTAFNASLTSTIQLQHRAFSTSVKCTNSRMQARSELSRRSRFIDRDDDSVDDSSPDAAAIRPARSLTHVNHDGEAHMVDVGSKNASKRVAIAVATIRFSNLTPYDQVLNNSNKKGDVLGVARIAGVMAAKRTSDMIPLCHPIMITKATVSLTLMAPVKELPHGSIHVEARVDCVGPTGVEMEALTAATTAALTIYDMCKAVDKDMVIQGSRVVMKTGGKSGTHISDEWLATKNREYFESARLNVPEDVRSCSMRT